jgi:hypothetical protein
MYSRLILIAWVNLLIYADAFAQSISNITVRTRAENNRNAAAAICAVLPFLWGWRRCAVIGWLISVLLLIPLSLTYSRTGFAVAGLEVVVWAVLSGRRKAVVAFLPYSAFVDIAQIAVCDISGFFNNLVVASNAENGCSCC